MDPCCLVCRSSEVDQLIPVSCVTSTNRKPISEMFDVFVKIRPNQMLTDVVLFPEVVCDVCLDRLDRAYRVWKHSRSMGLIRKCEKGKEEQYRACRICVATEEVELVSMFCYCKERRVLIAAMVEYLLDVKVTRGDRLPPYICTECLKDLNEGYGFKKDAYDSITFFQEQPLHPWQKMEFRSDCPKRLVVEVSCKGEVNLVDKAAVTCSVCSARNHLERLKRTCRGCKLEFRNFDEIQRQIEEHGQQKVEDDVLFEVFDDIADYDELVVEDVKLDLMLELESTEMPVKVEDSTVKKEEEPLVDESSKEHENLKIVSVKTIQRSKDKSVPKLNKPKASAASIETIIEYKCCFEGCSQYGTVEALHKHFEEVHPGISPDVFTSPFNCPICGTSFPDADSLRSHHGEACPLYRCAGSQCSFATRSHACAMRHLEAGKVERADKHGRPKPISIEDFDKFYIVDKQLDENSFTLKRLHERCCWCGDLFEELHELEAHRELMHDVVKAPFQCETCNRPFTSLVHLSHHRERNFSRTHFYCRPCKKTYWDYAPFKMHRNYEHSDVIDKSVDNLYESAILCCGCDAAFQTEQDLEEHRLQEHSPEDDDFDRPFCCNRCAQSFSTGTQLYHHSRKYQDNKVYCCLVLGCIFKTPKLVLIKNHVTAGCHTAANGQSMTIRRVNPLVYYCCVTHCLFEHSSYEEIIKHAASAHEEIRQQNMAKHTNAVSFRCEACFKNCDNPLRFLNHKNGTKKITCRYCKKLQPRSEIVAHIKVCQRSNEQICEVCSEILPSRRMLMAHMRSEHGVILPPLKPSKVPTPKVICSICGAMVSKHGLITHMQSHENKRAFKCDQCPKSFNTPILMHTHIKHVHSSRALYPCREGCDKRYKNPGDRQRHEQLVHLGITPHVCEICSVSFVRDRDLRLHSKKHTGRKLYGCDHCGADYDRLSDFKEHQRVCAKGRKVEEEDE